MRRVLLAFGLACSSAALLVAQQPAAESPAAVAAKKRQDAIKSAEFILHVKEITEPGALSPTGTQAVKGAKPFPESQVTVEATNRLLLDGDRIRYENNVSNFDARTNGLSNTVERAVSDGSTARLYHVPKDVPSRPLSYGLIEHPRKVMTWRTTLVLPLLVWCRAADTTHTPLSLASDFTLQPTKSAIRGRATSEYIGQDAHAKFHIFTDDADDHVVRRFRHHGPKGPTLNLDVEYRRDTATGLSVPSSWTQTLYNPDGRVRRTTAFTVQSAKLNPPVSSEEFNLSFPPGIDVRDQRTDDFFLVRDDGSLQQIRNPGDASPDVLREASQGWTRRHLWTLLFVGATSLALLIAISRRHVRRRSVPRPLGSSGAER